MEQQNEFQLTVKLAERLLDEPYADPDDDLRTLARQFNRAVEREDRLKAAIDWILILNSKKNPHLGRPRTSDMNCIHCMGYLAINFNAYGEKIYGEDYKKLAEAERASWEKKDL